MDLSSRVIQLHEERYTEEIHHGRDGMEWKEHERPQCKRGYDDEFKAITI